MQKKEHSIQQRLNLNSILQGEVTRSISLSQSKNLHDNISFSQQELVCRQRRKSEERLKRVTYGHYQLLADLPILVEQL